MTFLINKQARGSKKSKQPPNFWRQIFFGMFWLLLVVLCAMSIWYITRLPFFTITDISVSGGETISHEEIRVRLLDELNGAYFLIIPKRFSYMYPHDRMVSELEKNSRMHNIVIERSSRTTIGVSFDEYIPHALWCGEGDKASFCYFLTKDGFAFAEAPTMTGGTLVRHSVEGLTEILKGVVIDPQMLSAIDTFIERAEQELGFRITSLVHTKDGDIHFIINGGGMIYVAEGKDFTETFENVKTVLASKEFKHIKPGNFYYIDARFGNKIYVNEEIGTSTKSVSKLPE